MENIGNIWKINLQGNITCDAQVRTSRAGGIGVTVILTKELTKGITSNDLNTTKTWTSSW